MEIMILWKSVDVVLLHIMLYNTKYLVGKKSL